MIEILHYEKANRNKCIGYVDIKVPISQPVNLIFRNIAHLQHEDKRWFNLPQLCRETPEGRRLFLKLAQFEMEVHNNQMLASLSPLVSEFCDRHNIKDVQPLIFDSFGNVDESLMPF